MIKEKETERSIMHKLALQVLGSGGPMHAGGRGNAAYLLWYGGQPLLVLDMGGDTPAKLGAAGVKPGSVPLLLISHVHPDHVSGLPDFYWGEITAGRSKPLTIIGPPSADQFHDARGLFEKLFSKRGVFPDMSGLLEGQPFGTEFVEASRDGQTSFQSEALSITSMTVNHGDVPALAFRIDVLGSSIVFAGDQTMVDPAFGGFARDAQILCAHAIVTERAGFTPLGKTVATPSAIGTMARNTGAKRLLLGHWLGAPEKAFDGPLWSLDDSSGVIDGIAGIFDGEIVVAEDLDCYDIGGV